MTEFFNEQREASAIKTAIVRKYLSAWSKIMKTHHEAIGYIDLFSGPGCYEDGTESTPVLVVKDVLSSPDIAEKMVFIFNDIDQEKIDLLKSNITALPNIHLLPRAPTFNCCAVGDELAERLENMRLIPAFSFIDPFGYAGVTRRLITALTKDRGCDCVFFLNYSRINAGINNPSVETHISSLFGLDIERLRSLVDGRTPVEREEIIIDTLATSFSEINGRRAFVLPFRFLRPPGSRGTRTSHYLIFVSKNPLGYKIMKDIMRPMGSVTEEGIGDFQYIPTTNRQLTLLFGYSQTIEDLKQDLCVNFAGRRLLVEQVYIEHNYGTPFVLRNYQEAIRCLESSGRVICFPPASSRQVRKGIVTLNPKSVEVRFP